VPIVAGDNLADGDERWARVSLISVTELAEQLGGPNPPVVLDVRWPIPGPPDRAGYLKGHVRGARFVDLDTDLSAPAAGAKGGGHPLPSAAAFTAAMRGHGVRKSRPVVVYDLSNGLSAGRAWWCLRYFGHPDVRLLDGGFTAWKAARKPIAKGEPEPIEPGNFLAKRGHMPVLHADGAAMFPKKGLLLDARSAKRYRGEDPVDPVRGHVPGAVSAPTTDNVDASGQWLTAKELTARFRSLGVRRKAVGVYCGSGVTACHTVLAMTEAGLPTPALYVGSWSEWSAQGRPVQID
jgi:thiosulfate/3-mercaptopyruvate sulfurtransferase